MKIKTFIFLVLSCFFSTTNVSAGVITGINESTSALFTGGIEVNEFGIGWTEANAYFGYVYNGQYSGGLDMFFRPETQFANVVDSSVWFQLYDTYNGFTSNSEIKDASQYAYSSQNIMFADKNSPWYRGILLAKQGDNYLAIDPLDVYKNELGNYVLKYEYWYGTDGETDLSLVASVPEPSILLLLAISLFGLLAIRRTKMQKIVA
jgi:PEP-CTERM motif